MEGADKPGFRLLTADELAAVRVAFNDGRGSEKDHVTWGDHTLAEWEAANDPRVWQVVEEWNGWRALADVGYGMFALMDPKGKVLGWGTEGVSDRAWPVILLDKDYYGLTGYLHRPCFTDGK